MELRERQADVEVGAQRNRNVRGKELTQALAGDTPDHFAAQVAEVCNEHARLAYVIGNSKFYEHPLPSDEILASIFRHFGFKLEQIERMRKRQSKTGLYEAVIFMKRP